MSYYSDFYLKKRSFRIPLPIAIFTIFLITIFFANFIHKQSFPSKAKKNLLKRLEITNLTPNQATVIWETEEKTHGFIFYGEENKKLTSVALDERDTSNNRNKFSFHYVNLKNLIPDKKYFFVIVSNDQMIKKYEDEPFSFHTPKIQLQNKSPTLIYGKVFNTNNLPLANAMVIFRARDYYSLSSFSKETGEWLIPVSVVYSTKNLTPKILSSSEKVFIEILSEDGLKTKIEGRLDKLSSISQPLFIGRDYSFISEEEVLGEKIEKEDDKKDEGIRIIYPQDKAVIPGFTPLIKGVAVPERDVLVDIFKVGGSKNYSVRTKTDRNGLWSIKFSNNLEVGDYQLIFKTKDKDNKEVEIKRNFRLIGNQAIFGRVLGEGTPSATFSLSPTSQPLPTPTFELPTPSPTIFYSYPTITPTPFVSGYNIFTLISLLGVLAIILGLRLFHGF